MNCLKSHVCQRSVLVWSGRQNLHDSQLRTSRMKSHRVLELLHASLFLLLYTFSPLKAAVQMMPRASSVSPAHYKNHFATRVPAKLKQRKHDVTSAAACQQQRWWPAPPHWLTASAQWGLIYECPRQQAPLHQRRSAWITRRSFKTVALSFPVGAASLLPLLLTQLIKMNRSKPWSPPIPPDRADFLSSLNQSMEKSTQL